MPKTIRLQVEFKESREEPEGAPDTNPKFYSAAGEYTYCLGKSSAAGNHKVTQPGQRGGTVSDHGNVHWGEKAYES